MKVMSFNTQHCKNFIEQKIDYQIMADTIKRCGADIVALNEMRDQGTEPEYQPQTRFLSELTGLPHHYFAKAIEVRDHNPYGNGLLSRYPILSAETILIPDPAKKDPNRRYETRCILKAKLACGITVLATHFGLNPEEQENAVQTVLAHLENEKCIFMGDFNVRPDNAVLNSIRKRMKDAADAFETPLFSFRSDKPDRKIDYIFVSPDIEVVAADIPAIVASDHRPHTADLKIPGICL